MTVYNVIKEFRDPQHPEFRGKTLWNLYNSVTENLKGGDFSKLPKRTMTMQRIFDNVAKFKAPSVVEAEEVVSSLLISNPTPTGVGYPKTAA